MRVYDIRTSVTSKRKRSGAERIKAQVHIVVSFVCGLLRYFFGREWLREEDSEEDGADGPRNQRGNERDPREEVQSGTSGWDCEERLRDSDKGEEEG